MDAPQKRQVALKVKVSDLIQGRYVKEEGWQPNYILTSGGIRISRANIIAIVISLQKDGPSNSMIIDDGTGSIQLRSFDGFMDLKGIEVGDIVNVVGKPREFGQERYVLPEIIRKVEDKRWVEVRKTELELYGLPAGAEQGAEQNSAEEKEKGTAASVGGEEEIVEADVEEKENENPFQRIFNTIRTLDTGEGADAGEVSKQSGLKNADEIIGELLKEGEIFEIKRGRLKILE